MQGFRDGPDVISVPGEVGIECEGVVRGLYVRETEVAARARF